MDKCKRERDRNVVLMSYLGPIGVSEGGGEGGSDMDVVYTESWRRREVHVYIYTCACFGNVRGGGEGKGV